MIARYILAGSLTTAMALSAGAQARDRERDRDRDRDYTSTVDTVLPLARNGGVEIRLHSG